MPFELSRYTVDREGVILDVQVRHHGFSDRQDLPLPPFGLIGSQLYKYISGRETQDFTAQVLARARSSNIPLTIAYRCDSSLAKRYMTMTLSALDTGAVENRKGLLCGTSLISL
jgi:hypothetical protein